MFLRQSTASQEILLGRFVDATDGDTEETGLTIANTDIKLHKHGATTLASKNSGGGTHIANGLYYAVLDATDTDTVGNLEVHVHVSGALAVKREYVVLEEAVYDAFYAASAPGYVANAPVNVAQFGGSNGTFASGIPEVKTASLGTTAKSDVNAEVLDVLNVDTFAEPGQGTPTATPTMRQMMHYQYKWERNKKTQTSSQLSFFADDATTVDHKAAITDSSGTTTIGEIATGP